MQIPLTASRLNAAWDSWIEAERGRFVPWLAVFMGAGVCAYLALRAEPDGWIGPTSVGVAVLCCLVVWRIRALRAAALCLLAAAAGFASVQHAGATHEISLACRALTYDDAPSRWRWGGACRSKSWVGILLRSRTRAAPARSSTA